MGRSGHCIGYDRACQRRTARKAVIRLGPGTPAPKPAPRPIRTQAVVKRDHHHVFSMLSETMAARRDVDLLWDRRERDRRVQSTPVPGERRRAERRREPGSNWRYLGFVIVDRAEPGEKTHSVGRD